MDRKPQLTPRPRAPRAMARVLITMLISAGLLAGLVPSAYAASPYSRYATAFETGYTDRYTGGGTTRTDPATTITKCADPATGYLETIVQPLWVRWSYGWIETGTAHECSKSYWYVYICGTAACGYSYSKIFTVNGTHTHSIQRTSGTTKWVIKRDGTTIFTVDWNNTDKANRVDAGLEVHAPDGTIPLHKDTALKFAINDGAMQSWAGFDGWSVNSPACGGWNTASEWRSKFPATSC